MKKHYYIYGVMVLALVIASPAIIRAEIEDDDSSNSTSDSVLPIIRSAILRSKGENNESLRNKITKTGLGLASTTRAEIKDLRREDNEQSKEIESEDRDNLKNASSSQERREIKKEMRKDLFEIHKDILIRQLNLALNNLRQIRDRIAARITKVENSGRDMTNAKNLLMTADGKITFAQQSIDALVVLVPPIASTTIATSTATSTVNINLTKPREIGASAIRAVKDIHKALVDVVRAIAHSMGLKLGDEQASTTPPITPPITSTTTNATSTATTTP